MADRTPCTRRPGGLTLTQRGLAAAAIRPAGHVVDVGCGAGATAGLLTELGYDAVGVDVDIDAVSAATAACPAARFVTGDACALPFGGEYADGLLAECVLSLLPDAGKAIAEAARVLRWGGSVILTDLYAKKEGLETGGLHLRERETIEALIRAAGLEIVLFEDHTPALREYYARLLFEGEGGDCPFYGADMGMMKRAVTGYYLLVAKKRADISPVYTACAAHLGANRETQLALAVKSALRARKCGKYYGTSLAGRDISPDPAVWSRIPFTTAADLARDPQGFLAVSPVEIPRVVTLQTSGTRLGKRVFLSGADLEATVDFFAAGMSGLVSEGETVCVFMREGPDSIADLLRRGLEKLGVSCRSLWDFDDINEAIEAARGAACVVAQPGFARTLCLAAPQLSPRAVLLSADYIPKSFVRLIERVWGCTVYAHYGMTETGFGLAVDCRCRDGMHMRDDEFLVEIIDPKTLLPIPDGEAGEVVLTTLRDRAMPLIRYRTGDIARLITTPCACGGAFPRLGRVEGRLGGDSLSMAVLDETLGEIEALLYYDAATSAGELVISCFAPGGLDRVETALAAAGIEAKLREIPAPDIRLSNKKRSIRTE
ncbi:MAG TPA: methyltransferase domain-containing protein [Candidatus Acidoferrum sp.]|nr:methyltransferase domain-containing protein [Candidatus Acidoferrum sp.]